MIRTMKLRELKQRAGQLDGQQVTIAGWVRTIRESRNFAFMELSDGSCFGTVQVVLLPGARLCVCAYPHYHHQRLRRRR